jgi:hypothetical protein
MLATVVANVKGALVAVVARILLADKPRAHAEAVLNGFVNAIEVALYDVAVQVHTLQHTTTVSAALIASAFVLVVALLIRLAPLGAFRLITAPDQTHNPQGDEKKHKANQVPHDDLPASRAMCVSAPRLAIRNSLLASRFWAQVLRLGRAGAAGALVRLGLSPA